MPLDPKARRAMKLSPLREHEPGVALGKGRIAVLTEDALVVRDTTKFEEVARVSVHGAQRLTTLSDGSFVAADSVHTAWLLPYDTRARAYAHVVMLPDSTWFADRETPNVFWVLSRRGGTLYEYVLSSSAAALGLLVTKEWISLDGFDGRVFGSLRDGSFIYSTASGFSRFDGPLGKNAVEGDAREAFRVLPGSRVDTLWLVTKDGATLHRLLFGKLVKLRSVAFSAMSFDVDADGEYLAVLELREPGDRAWSFELEVFDVEGKRRVHEPLRADESLDPDGWVRALMRNRHLSIADGPTPLVAVGGPENLSVWRADDGTRVLPVR